MKQNKSNWKEWVRDHKLTVFLAILAGVLIIVAIVVNCLQKNVEAGTSFERDGLRPETISDSEESPETEKGYAYLSEEEWSSFQELMHEDDQETDDDAHNGNLTRPYYYEETEAMESASSGVEADFVIKNTHDELTASGSESISELSSEGNPELSSEGNPELSSERNPELSSEENPELCSEESETRIPATTEPNETGIPATNEPNEPNEPTKETFVTDLEVNMQTEAKTEEITTAETKASIASDTTAPVESETDENVINPYMNLKSFLAEGYIMIDHTEPSAGGAKAYTAEYSNGEYDVLVCGKGYSCYGVDISEGIYILSREYDGSSLRKVTIPSTIGGYPVKALDQIYYEAEGIESIYIPASVKFMDGTFTGCRGVKKVTIEKGSELVALGKLEQDALSVCYETNGMYDEEGNNICLGATFYCDRDTKERLESLSKDFSFYQTKWKCE